MKNFCCEKGSAFLLTDRLTRKYFCGVDIAEGTLVITNVLTTFTDARYFSAAKPELEKVGVNVLLYKDLFDIKDFLINNGVTKLLIDYSKTTVREYESYKTFGIEISDGSNTLEEIKSVKTEEELRYIKKACSIAEKAYYSAIKTVKKGITEKELKEVLERFMSEYGGEGTSFDTIVAFGKNAAIPHHETGDTVLTENTPILVDMGCKVNGYCSDITRTAFFGTPSNEFIKCYNAVLDANELAIEKITDGVKTDVADGYARDILTKAGYGELFTHSLGHGVGQEIHEYPTLSPKKSQTLKNGMVFTIEPGVYIDGKFGIRIEDTVVLENGKVKRLYTDDKKLLILKLDII
ncbi:MAG: aminopeptidase P family protein [Clostridia bacterium]|nr:aminopeptidase P family protein [Clostridia bacterium]